MHLVHRHLAAPRARNRRAVWTQASPFGSQSGSARLSDLAPKFLALFAPSCAVCTNGRAQVLHHAGLRDFELERIRLRSRNRASVHLLDQPKAGAGLEPPCTRSALAARDLARSPRLSAVKHLHILSYMILKASATLRGGETRGTGVRGGCTHRNAAGGPALELANCILRMREPFASLTCPFARCCAGKTETAGFPSNPLPLFGKPPCSG